MRRRGLRTCSWLMVALVLILAAAPAFALGPKSDDRPLARKEFFRPDLHLSMSNTAIQEGLTRIPNSEAWARFLADQGGDVQAYLDPRSGTPSSIILHLPIIPGTGAGNHVTTADLSESFSQSLASVDSEVVARAITRFVNTNQAVLGVDLNQLGTPRVGLVSDSLWQISYPQQVNGIPVRHGRLLATINHGNLVLIGTETWGNVQVGTNPTIGADEAVHIAGSYFEMQQQDKIWRDPALEIVPVAPLEYEVGEAFAGPIGQGYSHRLVWTFGVVRPGDGGMYEAIVDAHTGDVLSFEDTNQYAASRITGGVYPLTSTGVCPSPDRCGIMQPGYPMPFANTGFAPPNDFTNSAGVYNYSSGTVTTSLSGKFVRVTDTCGAISESSATGNIDLGGTNGQHDCTTSGTSPGDTPATRAAFYEVNKIKELARGWLPANPWLNLVQQTNVNLNSTCNAFYSPGAGTINFYRSGGGCRNTGEIAAVFDHEWGHALDDNDTVGTLSNASETYADVAFNYRLQASCVGYGFWFTADQGCGMTSDGTGFNGNNAQVGAPVCELDCSGVRGADWDMHAGHVPDTSANFSCPSCSSGSGPCGREVHCDAMPATEAAWDLAARDLQAAPYSYDSNTAFIIANKLFYQGSGSIGNWLTCTCPSTSNGCGATNAYLQWLTADDDNGNLNDGTPHMTALFNAFNRHNMACTTPTVTDSGCAGGPTTAPAVTLAAGSNQITVNWTSVPGATTYWVMRTEGISGCNTGKARIATVAGNTYTDNNVANGTPYYYQVVAQGTTEACYGPAGACVTGTPQPCAGAVSVNKPTYTCNDLVSITLVDSDLIGGGTHTVDVFSTPTEPTPPETITLVESPANSGIFVGAIATTPGPAGPDGSISVANGDTITVRYIDASFCGPANVVVDQTAAVDCVGPVISNVHSNSVTGNSANVLWDTDELSNSSVTYDTAFPPVANITTKPALVTSHTVPLTGLAECTPYFYSVASTDASGNVSSDDNSSAYYTFTTGKNVNPTYPYTGAPVLILDPPAPGTLATITVLDNKPIQHVSVKVSSLRHTFDGDLAIHLIHGATDILLSNRRGSGGDNFINTVFDDAATTPIASGTAPFTGSFKPDNALSVFNGTNAAGDWSLRVVDLAAIDTGTLDSWSITFNYPPQACGPNVEYQSSTPTDSCAGGGGNAIIEPGEDVTLPVIAHNNGTDPVTGVTGKLSSTTPGVTITQDTASFPDLAVDGTGSSAPPHFKFIVDAGVPCGSALNFKVTYTTGQGTFNSTFSLPTGTPGNVTTPVSSTDVPKIIADNSIVTSSLPVAGLGTILDVNATIGSITHTFDGDLILSLISPTGTRVALSNRRGSSGDNFTNTVFDDEGATPIGSGTPPYTGTFIPDAALSAVDGQSANGTWILEVNDAATIDTGTLHAWSLTFQTSAAPSCNSCVQPLPAEVQNEHFTTGTKDTLAWDPAANAAFYNVYRGAELDLPKLYTPQQDSCLREVTTGTSTGPTLNSPADMVIGTFRWYLVRAGNGAGEGSAGSGTQGPRIQNSSGACP